MIDRKTQAFPTGAAGLENEVRVHLNEIRNVVLGGWSNHHDQDFGTKDAEYCLDVIREHVLAALKSEGRK